MNLKKIVIITAIVVGVLILFGAISSLFSYEVLMSMEKGIVWVLVILAFYFGFVASRKKPENKKK